MLKCLTEICRSCFALPQCVQYMYHLNSVPYLPASHFLFSGDQFYARVSESEPATLLFFFEDGGLSLPMIFDSTQNINIIELKITTHQSHEL